MKRISSTQCNFVCTVTGVNFRGRTADKARSFGVVGWVRNRAPSGDFDPESAEGEVEGELWGVKVAVSGIVEWLKTANGVTSTCLKELPRMSSCPHFTFDIKETT